MARCTRCCVHIIAKPIIASIVITFCSSAHCKYIALPAACCLLYSSTLHREAFSFWVRGESRAKVIMDSLSREGDRHGEREMRVCLTAVSSCQRFSDLLMFWIFATPLMQQYRHHEVSIGSPSGVLPAGCKCIYCSSISYQSFISMCPTWKERK